MRCALLLCLIALLVASAVSPGSSLAALTLNEVLPAPGSDWDGDLDPDSKRDEWVEIVNAGSLSCDISCMLLLSGGNRSPVYGFTGSVSPGEVVLVYGSDAVVWEGDNGHSSIGLSLNNGGDVIYLAEAVGGDTLIVDSLVYSSADVAYDVSLGRLPDGSGGWTAFDHFSPMGGAGIDPTPGASNSANPPPHILGLSRIPLFPTSADSTRIVVDAGDASGITQVLLAYDINLEDGEEPQMELVSGTTDLGAWAYTILPCAAGDTVHYRVSVYDALSSNISPWMGYRVRSSTIQVRLNEILADPPADLAGDANRDGERDAADDEFVEIVNCGPTPIDMSGWHLSDAISIRHEFPETGMIVQPGEYVTIFGGGTPTGFGGMVSTASSGGLGLTNSGDVVSLHDAGGSIVDIHSYGGEGGHDEALIRLPDCSGEWLVPSAAGLERAFTPHEPNSGQSATGAATWGDIKSLFR
jgi:hypothetical protein